MPSLARYYRSKHERYLSMLKWREHLPELTSAIGEVLPDAKAYVFGSAPRGELTANSDVDVLIVTSPMNARERSRVALAIEDRVREPSMFELHLADSDGFRWYRRHAKELLAIEEAVKA